MDSSSKSSFSNRGLASNSAKQNFVMLNVPSTVGALKSSVIKSECNRLEHEPEHDDDDEGEDNNSFTIPQKFTKSGKKRAIPFPLKLMKVLSCLDYEHIISWMPSGRSFMVKKPKLFTCEILPSHFKTAKFSSFTRKLHRWGFMRHYRGSEAGAFFHLDFQRDRLDLVEKMTCCKVDQSKGTDLSPSLKSDRLDVSDHTQNSVEYPSSDSTTASALIIPAAVTEQVCYVKQNSSCEGNSTLCPDQLPVTTTSSQFMDPVFGFRNQTEATRPLQTSFWPSTNLPSNLNAVIEAEISRRISERIQAVAMAEEALDIMQRQANPLLGPSLNSFLHHQLSRNQFVAGNTCTANQAPSGLPSLSTRTILSLAAQGLYKPAPLNIAALQRLRSLPHTNIQGAKTA